MEELESVGLGSWLNYHQRIDFLNQIPPNLNSRKTKPLEQKRRRSSQKSPPETKITFFLFLLFFSCWEIILPFKFKFPYSPFNFSFPTGPDDQKGWSAKMNRRSALLTFLAVFILSPREAKTQTSEIWWSHGVAGIPRIFWRLGFHTIRIWDSPSP